LLVQLAMARYLSTEQIGELVFPGTSSCIARRRLSLLRRGGLLFVAPVAAHRDAIAQWAAGEWYGSNEALPFNVRILTFEEAHFELCRMAGLPSGRSSGLAAASAVVSVTAAEVRALYEFYNATIAGISAVRRFAKSQPGIATLPLPEYPANHETMKGICVRLAGRLR
jgi:hypothetical protein